MIKKRLYILPPLPDIRPPTALRAAAAPLVDELQKNYCTKTLSLIVKF